MIFLSPGKKETLKPGSNGPHQCLFQVVLHEVGGRGWFSLYSFGVQGRKPRMGLPTGREKRRKVWNEPVGVVTGWKMRAKRGEQQGRRNVGRARQEGVWREEQSL